MNKYFSIAIITLLFSDNIHAQNWPNGSIPLAPSVSDAFPGDFSTGVKVNRSTINIIHKQGVTAIQDVSSLTLPYVTTNSVYTDGIGRTIQTVFKQGSPTGNDVVSTAFFNADGRATINPMPFILGGTPAGNFKTSAFTGQQNFYSINANVPDIATNDNLNAYSKMAFDDATLYRDIKKMDPGASKVGSNVGVDSRTILNDPADEVELWQYNSVGTPPSKTGVLQSNTLSITETTDERGKRIRIYKDIEGKVLLSKTEVSATSAGNGHVGWLCTYYVYDEMNRLRSVITPKVVAAIQSSGWVVSQSMMDNVCYSYDYDFKNRIVWKKIPGQQPIRMIYDVNDRAVLIQDGKLAGSNQWMFTKYDVMGRAIMTGRYLNPQAITPATLSSLLNGTGTSSDGFVTFINTPLIFNIYNTTSTIANSEIYGLNYFDSYSVSGYSYNDAIVQNLPNVGQLGVTEKQSTNTTGLKTGSYTRIMDGTTATSQWESSVYYYDQYGRIVQVQSTNYKGGRDTISSRYNFSGAVISSLASQSNPTVASGQINNVRVFKNYYYDNQGRLTSVYQKINDDPYFRRLNLLNYNNLGNRVANKTYGTNAEIQQYRYRIWGALESINKGFCGSGGSNVAFGEIINYDYGFAVNDKSMPSGIMWRTEGRSNVEQSYGYSYDAAGRLVGADYARNDGSGYTDVTANYSARNIGYDANGNLSHMEQWGTKLGYSAPFLMDNLDYAYSNSGMSNQLQGVKDNITNDYGLGEFTEAISTTTDYNYDNNGNITMDNNKNISAISYTYSNKPYLITFANNRSIKFTYDAAGVLLSKQINENGNISNIDYVGSLEYDNGSLTSSAHDEGRVRPVVLTASNGSNSWGYEYDFFIKDHQGNIRSVLTEEPDANWWDPSTGGLPTQRIYDPRNPGNGTLFTGFTVGSFDYRVSNELNKAAVERATFSNVDSTRSVKPLSTDPNDVKATLLNADNNIIGPSIMLRVMAGDNVTINTSAYYDQAGGNTTSNATPGQLASALITALTGSGSFQTLNEAGLAPDLTGNAISQSKFVDAMQTLKNSNTADGTKPQAFLNYLMLDEDMNVVDDQSGFIQTTEPGFWNVLSVPQTKITRNGYLIVFLSNESHMNVNFDNLNVTHYKGTLKEENQYYPYGLTLTTKAVTNYPDNNILLAGKDLNRKEFSDGSGLNWYDFGARQYDPQIGMWHVADPMGEKTYRFGQYQYCNNNPVIFSDPSGMFSLPVKAPVVIYTDWGQQSGRGSGSGNAAVKNLMDFLAETDATAAEKNGVQYDWGSGKYMYGTNEVGLENAMTYYGGIALTNGQGTIYFNMQGTILGAINDGLKFQLDFMNTKSSLFSDKTVSNAIDGINTLGDADRTKESSTLRGLSSAFIGSNSIASLEKIVDKSASMGDYGYGVELGFTGDISSSREILFSQLPVPGGPQSNWNQGEFPMKESLSLFKSNGGDFNDIFSIGHTHIANWFAAPFGTIPISKWSTSQAINYYGIPTRPDVRNGAYNDYSNFFDRYLPEFIASPVGLTIYQPILPGVSTTYSYLTFPLSWFK